MAIEIVSFPMKNGDFPVGNVNIYQAGYPPKSAPRWKKQERTKNCKAGETIQRPQFLVPRTSKSHHPIRNSQRESMVLVQDGAPQL